MSIRSQAEAALQNPNVRLFLDLLAEAEGASKGYRTLFGGSAIHDLSDHPRIFQDYVNSTTGEVKRTSAAGRYQFKADSWDEQAKRLGLKDFSPESQDLAAIGLMMYKPKAMAALQAGDFDTALKEYGTFWASLPSSPHKQPHRSQAWVQDKLNELQSKDLRSQHMAMAGEAPSGGETWKGVPFSAPTIELSPFEGIPPERDMQFSQFMDTYMPRAAAPSQYSAPTGADADIVTPFTDPFVAASIDADADRARNEAVALFTGAPLQHDIALPKAIDASIRKLLVEL